MPRRSQNRQAEASSSGSGKNNRVAANVAAAQSSHNALYFGPRLGLDLPLGRWLSAEAIGSLELGFEDYDETSGPNENKSSDSVIALVLHFQKGKLRDVKPAGNAQCAGGPEQS